MNNCCCEKKVKRSLFYRIKMWFRRRKQRKMPSKLERWALNELQLLEKQAKDDEEGLMMQKTITKDVMAIVKVFCAQGHSGFSASYVLGLIRLLLDWKPIKELTGEDDEWEDVEEWDKEDNQQQNKRCSAVFRTNFDNSTARLIDGKVFSDDGGETWFTNKDSSVPVKFPFKVPLEPEYVYLATRKEDEVNEDEKI